jgi:hypothetical protein
MIKAEKLQAIVDSDDQDPRVLCELVGGDPRSFYCGANFNHTDLRGVDFRGYDLTASTFENAWLDRNTRVDAEYFDITGLTRTVLMLPYARYIMTKIFGRVRIESSLEDHLGDIVEEALRFLDSRINDWSTFFKNSNDGKPLWVPVDQVIIDLVGSNNKLMPSKSELLGKLNSSKTTVGSSPLLAHISTFDKHSLTARIQKLYSIERELKDLRRPTKETIVPAAILKGPLKKITKLSSIKKVTPELFCSELLLTYSAASTMKKEGFTSWISLQ